MWEPLTYFIFIVSGGGAGAVSCVLFAGLELYGDWRPDSSDEPVLIISARGRSPRLGAEGLFLTFVSWL